MAKKRLLRHVDIIGVGNSTFGMADRSPNMLNFTSRELWTQAVDSAVKDAGIQLSDIEAMYVGNMQASYNEGQYHLGYVLDMWSGLEIKDGMYKSAVRVEDACASSSHAIRQAVFAVASGAYDIVIAGGVEQGNTQWNWRMPGKALSMDNKKVIEGIFAHLDQGWEITEMNMLDHVMSQWMIGYAKHYGLSKSQLLEMLNARVISNWTNGIKNKDAYWNPSFESILEKYALSSIEDVLMSDKINPVRTWPIRRWDYMRRVDGASAVIVCSADAAHISGNTPIHYLGTGNAIQQYAMSRDVYHMPFVEEAGRQAYEMAGITAKDVDIVEMYDFGPAEYFLPLEDLGFWERGSSLEHMRNRDSLFTGATPVNPHSGGSTCGCASGPIGATCIGSVVQELRGKAGGNQVTPLPSIGMVYDCGGARNCVIHLLGR